MLTDKISTRAAAYGVEGSTVDGNDVDAVYKAALEASNWVRETRKPYLLETYTYRTAGHYEPDDLAYVDPTELQSWRAKDPIENEKQRLRAAGLLNDASLREIEARVSTKIAEAVAFANEAPFPDASELTTDLYA
jgi:pyruvate dehydrogenase E1 component alpha subunit